MSEVSEGTRRIIYIYIIYIYMGVSQNGRSPKPLVSILNWSNDLDDLGYSHNF